MRRTWLLVYVCVAGLMVGGPIAVRGQDTRVVTEPKVPPVCVKLEAKWIANVPEANAGRDEDEGKLDTERIQKALNACQPGHAVELTEGSTCVNRTGSCGTTRQFITGPLDLPEGVTLLIDQHVTLYASRNPAVYDLATGSEPKRCGTSIPRPADLPVFSLNATAKPKGGCRALININDASGTAVMGLGTGDAIGTIDGRGYARLVGHDYSWWELARRAQPNDDLYWSTKLITATRADGFILYNLRLVNAPNYHVTVAGTNGFTAWGVHLQTPVDKRLDTRNTDGIDPGSSQNITIAHSWIDNGDDNIAIKQGVTHMSVLDNHFYSGHGMSIGSETVLGQSFLLVDGLTEEHTTSGIRIKSNVKRGGPVHDLTYRNICMKDVPIPIAISPYYTNQTVEPFEDPKYEGDKIPDYKSIVLDHIYAETPGDVLIAGLDDAHRTEITLDSVHIEGIQPRQVHMKFVQLHQQSCQADHLAPRTNFSAPQGETTVHNDDPMMAGCGAYPVHPVDPCTNKFVPMR